MAPRVDRMVITFANLPGRATHSLRDERKTLCGRPNNGAIRLVRIATPDCFTCRQVLKHQRTSATIKAAQDQADPTEGGRS